MFQKRLQFYRSVLYLGDLVLVAVCWLSAYFLRFYAPIIPVTKGIPELSMYLTLLFLVLAVFALVLPSGRLYRRPWAGLPQLAWPLFRSVTLAVLVAVSLTYFLRPYDFSRLVFAYFYGLAVVAMLILRPLSQHFWLRTKSRQRGEGVLIVGVEDLGRQVASNINKHPELGLKIVGFLTRRPEMVGKIVEGAKVLGEYTQIPEVLAQHEVQVVIIALPLSAHNRINEVLDNIADEMVDIKIVPDLYRYMRFKGSVEEFEGMPIIGIRSSPLEGWNLVAKRAMDVAGSLLALLLASPVMILVALGVRLTSKGPIFYRQKRMGMDGRLFEMIKFRSMYIHAERECGPVWACKDDPRCTPFGSFIRRWSLDELPQLFNVLKGDMSLVGPRPERPEFIAEFRRQIPGYMLRHKIKAGITGWAQIHGWRGNTSLEKRIEHDLYYIDHWSPLFDIKILLRTMALGFVNPNAY